MSTDGLITNLRNANNAAEIARLEAERDRWRRVAEYGWHLHNYGENAPGGTETWREFERLIRAAADAS